ncbi:hypothetical protein LTR84_009007 [Exophiala bonariae]|uniref:Uncharacterized protein n=1 Tax=Exophiala bonariae TaxID=1690606 RepID=A0AAV9MYJ5_9EURO|nr:hypothetical protein LTR84_009007 [Exophiala bonariae]
MSETDIGFIAALEEAKQGYAEGGVPIGLICSRSMSMSSACILYKVARVVIAENKTFVGGEEHLKSKGIEVVVLDNAECKELMRKFIEEKPHIWNEDIGEP